MVDRLASNLRIRIPARPILVFMILKNIRVNRSWSNPVFIRQPFQGIHITILLMLHDKADRVAGFTATKTFIQFFGGGDGERGGLLIMKRAKPQVIGAPLFELDEAADDLDNIDPA